MPQTPPVYTAHDIADLINALPALFGFRPQESLVAVATTGPRRRLGFRLRVDLPRDDRTAAVARFVVGHMRRQGAQGVILIAVTQHQEVARQLLEACHRELGDIDLIVRARTDGHRYWTDEPGCSAEGVVYVMDDCHLSIVEAVAAGQEILPDREAVADRFAAVTGERRRRMEHRAISVLDEVITDVSRLEHEEVTRMGLQIVEPILCRGLAGGHLADDELLRLAAWTSKVGVRDAVWARITHGSASQMLPLLALVCRHVVPPFEPAVLSLAAFAAWMTGDGTQALIAVERALKADPDYSMARTMLGVLEAGISPIHWSGSGR